MPQYYSLSHFLEAEYPGHLERYGDFKNFPPNIIAEIHKYTFKKRIQLFGYNPLLDKSNKDKRNMDKLAKHWKYLEQKEEKQKKKKKKKTKN